jgi:hypothetical protein
MTNGDRHVWQTAEWKSGWLMGIGFGVLVCVFAAQLPKETFERWTMLFLMAAVVTSVWRIMTYKSASKKPPEQQSAQTQN